MTILLRVIPLFCLLLVGCTTYSTKNLLYETSLQEGNFKKALHTVDHNRFLKRGPNKLLFLFEKAKAAHLLGDYKASNELFNEADLMIESPKSDITGAVLGTLVNPEMQAYRGEDFEKVAVHYYKSLNYIFMNQYDEALVEAKRINLQLQRINDKYAPDRKNRYTTDAFALNLTGLLYEATGNVNDAFISYRNAVDLYLKDGGSYFGVDIPQQLKLDLLRTAHLMGFEDVKLRYQDSLKINYQPQPKPAGGELIVFWENGMVPYKDQTYIAFTLLPGKNDGMVTIANEELGLNFGLPLDSTPNNGGKLSDLEIFNVAFPKYMERTPMFGQAMLQTPDSTQQFGFELAENYSAIAFKTLKDRMLREIGKTALRLAVKKIEEHAIRKENEGLGALAGFINAMTEHADTRNWQSLPNQIHYTRIPLQKGSNQFSFSAQGANGEIMTEEITVEGTGGLQFRNVVTLKSQPRFTY